MELHFKPKPFQYTYRGVDKAIATVKSAVDKGQVSAALFDISNFFGSFECSELANELPLQKEAVNSVVVGRQMAVELMKAGGGHTCALPSLSLTTLLWQARQGLPQGSSTSPIIAAYILARLAWNASTQVVLVNYADDFILLAFDEEALEPEIGKLQDAVAQLPGGHFKLRLIEKRHLSKGVDFLGHHLELVNGQLRTTPTDGNWEAALSVNNEIETKLLHFKPGKAHKHKDLIALAKVQAHTDGWVAAFKECDNIAELKEFLQTTIAQTADAIGVTLAQVKAAVDPSMTYRDKGYALKI